MVALVLAGCAVFGLFISGSIASAHRLELQDLETAVRGKGFSESMAVQQEFYKKYPDAIVWMGQFALTALGTLLLSLAAVICGVIGVRRPVRRGMAVTSIIMGAVVPIMICAGMLP